MELVIMDVAEVHLKRSVIIFVAGMQMTCIYVLAERSYLCVEEMCMDVTEVQLKWPVILHDVS